MKEKYIFGFFGQNALKDGILGPVPGLAMLVATAFCALSAAGATMSDFAAKSIVTDDGTLPYRETLVNAGGAGRPALVIYMHGASGRGNDNVRQMRQQGIYYIYDSMQNRGIKGYLLVPQCPEDRYWPGNRDYEPYTDPVKRLINIYLEGYNINTNCVYIFGASMGGAGTWKILSEMPGVFAAALVASGDYRVRGSQFAALARTPAYLTVGGEEGNSRVSDIRELSEGIAAAGGETRFEVLDGLDHADTCVDSFSDERNGWVFRHVRNAGLVISFR